MSWKEYVKRDSVVKPVKVSLRKVKRFFAVDASGS
jgi:hypothetical protein